MKDKYYLKIAETVSERSTCLRRQFGVVIVKNDEIIATGYNGPPRGFEHCKTCKRQDLGLKSGERYELCRAVHAEVNAVISASRQELIGSTLYLAGSEKTEPCLMCKRIIVNAGISKVVMNNKVYIPTDWEL
jgi:dCMP deaminase